MYKIRFSVGVESELRRLRVFDQRRILEEIQRQLDREPLKPTKRRKLLENVAPPEDWGSEPPFWQLKVGDFRVFYDVDQEKRTVFMLAVRKKPAHLTTEEIL
jgi:mRNA-degrading endonuclease RelE of RelBE toxin-antitoxin system